MTNYGTVGHHEGFMDPRSSKFFPSFLHLVVLLACRLCVFLCFVFHKSGATNLSSVMERVFFCYGYNGYMMEMCILLCKGDWWGVSMSLTKGGLRTWISSGSHGRKRAIFLELSFLLLACWCVLL